MNDCWNCKGEGCMMCEQCDHDAESDFQVCDVCKEPDCHKVHCLDCRKAFLPSTENEDYCWKCLGQFYAKVEGDDYE